MQRFINPLIILGFGVLSSLAIAQTSGEIPYGGLRVYTLTCTCSGNALVYLMDYRTNSILSLVYQPGSSILYSNYNVYGATYLLGSYSSGGATCQIYVGEDCTTINSSGMMGSQPGTGTS